MHFCLEWVFYVFSKTFASCWTKVLKFVWLLITDMSRFCMPRTNEEMNSFSSSLFFLIDHMLVLVFISLISILIISGTWSDGLQISGWSICWPKPVLSGGRKIRSMTELISHGLSANLVELGFKGEDISRPKLSVIVMRSLVWEKWCLKLGSQSLSLMLKSLIRIM